MSPLERLQWAAAVAADSTVGDRAKAIAAVFAFIINSKTGECFHSMATLARLAGKCERSTRLAVRELESAGWLMCRTSRGRTSNVYAPDFQKSSTYDPFPGATQHEDAGFTQQEGAGMGRSNPASSRINPASDDLQPGMLVPPTRQDHAPKQGNKTNNACGSAPEGAQASAKTRKLTSEENAAKGAEFKRTMAAKGLMMETPTAAVMEPQQEVAIA